MSFFDFFDRKFVADLLNIDKRFDTIEGSIKEYATELKDNTKRLTTLEADFKNCKENSSTRVKNEFNDSFDKKIALYSLARQNKNNELSD
jgi:hypothetical protein